MTPSVQALGEAITQVAGLRAKLAKKKTQPQVRKQDELDEVKQVASAWFSVYQKQVAATPGESLAKVQAAYTALLTKADKASARKGYLKLLAELRSDLMTLRSSVLMSEQTSAAASGAAPPDFSPLTSDATMQTILARRWNECMLCLACGADLAAVVMMGGLLESLLLARVNQTSDKSPIFTAASAPKDSGSKTLKLRDWTLNDYILVARELKWIGEVAKDVSGVLRDYRNYIHPSKELANQMSLTSRDTALMWTIFVTLTDQILKSAATRTP
jgi:hypothetical protein